MSLVTLLIEPPLQLAISAPEIRGPRAFVPGLWDVGRIPGPGECRVRHAERRHSGNRKRRPDEHWFHNSHFFLRSLLTQGARLPSLAPTALLNVRTVPVSLRVSRPIRRSRRLGGRWRAAPKGPSIEANPADCRVPSRPGTVSRRSNSSVTSRHAPACRLSGERRMPLSTAPTFCAIRAPAASRIGERNHGGVAQRVTSRLQLLDQRHRGRRRADLSLVDEVHEDVARPGF